MSNYVCQENCTKKEGGEDEGPVKHELADNGVYRTHFTSAKFLIIFFKLGNRTTIVCYSRVGLSYAQWYTNAPGSTSPRKVSDIWELQSLITNCKTTSIITTFRTLISF